MAKSFPKIVTVLAYSRAISRPILPTRLWNSRPWLWVFMVSRKRTVFRFSAFTSEMTMASPEKVVRSILSRKINPPASSLILFCAVSLSRLYFSFRYFVIAFKAWVSSCVSTTCVCCSFTSENFLYSFFKKTVFAERAFFPRAAFAP